MIKIYEDVSMTEHDTRKCSYPDDKILMLVVYETGGLDEN